MNFRDPDLKLMIGNMIRGQIAFNRGFNSDEDVQHVVDKIIFSLELFFSDIDNGEK